MDFSYIWPGAKRIEPGELAKTYYRRSRKWSVETGYDTGEGEATPLSTPVKKSSSDFEIGNYDEFEFSPAAGRAESDSTFFNFDQSIFAQQSNFGKLRAITKKTEHVESVIDQVDEKAVYKLAEQLTDLRFALAKEGRWNFQEEMEPEMLYEAPTMIPPSPNFEDNGWKYPTTIAVPILVGEKRRHFKKKQQKETCEFCRNNNEPNWEDHQCKNEYGEIICPSLSSLTCPICGATGKRAHTKRHCPKAERRKRRELEIGFMSGCYD